MVAAVSRFRDRRHRESGVKAGVIFTLRLLVGVLAGPLDHSTNDIDPPDLLTKAARSDNDAQRECVHEIIDAQRQLSTGLINLVNSVPMNDEARESMTEFAEELAARDLFDAGRLDMIDTASCECNCNCHEDAADDEPEADMTAGPKLSRILQNFENRQWIRKQDAVYEATAFGSWIADCLTALEEALSTSDDLQEFEPWLPTDIDGFDASWLADADIITPTPTEPNAPMDRVERALRTGQSVRVLSYVYNKNCLDANVTAVRERGQRYEGVYSDDAIQSLRNNPEWRAQLETILDADTTVISVYDGEIPCSVKIVDEMVHLILRDERGVVRAVIESESRPLHDWANSLFESHLEDAESVSELST